LDFALTASLKLSVSDEKRDNPSNVPPEIFNVSFKELLLCGTELTGSLMDAGANDDLLSGKNGVTFLPISGLGKRPLSLVPHLVCKPTHLLRDLADFGYTKVQRLEKPGEFRYLGDVLDVFPFRSQKAFRLEFWGNEIEAIKELDLAPPSFEQRIEEKLRRSFLEKIMPGDYVVHADHGIGRFVRKQSIEGNMYLVLAYARGDTLFVPEKTDKLTPYIGFGNPRVHGLNTLSWASTKRKVNEAAFKLARELLELYAKRELAARPPFTFDDKEISDAFAKSAGFVLTPDQKTAVADILRDLSSRKPMDRLICGDVGFGKTEVALQAALHMIGAGKQVVLLTPTTILADQHFHYIAKRFEPFGMSSSLVSRAQAESNYNADLIVGTHKILFRLDKIPRLGMVIIDEEQKFGVRQKEKFKELRASIDMLSLSATPIPRTFQLALAGLRDISHIITPLPGKEPIETFIFPFDEEKIKEAIEEELRRGGQVYYLVPRIRDIARVEEMFRKLFGDAFSFDVAHGRLPEAQLLRTVHRFRQKAFSLLVATTIIENGLDLENVNTLVVQDAQKLGLAQAHQIRGRVGRRFASAKAYFFYNKRSITPEGKKRLRTLRQFQGLGENYEIAIKDLEIRGAGSILGKEQSGNIQAVGLQLYSEMLKEAVKTLSKHAKLEV